MNNNFQNPMNGMLSQNGAYGYYPQSTMDSNRAPQYQQSAWWPTNNAQNNVYQQPAQTPQNLGLIGRVVNNEQDIKPAEVPMNGSPAIFPLNDGKTILVKVWGSEGKILTYRYQHYPEGEDTQNAAGTSVTLDSISKQIDSLKSQLDNMSYKHGYKNKNAYKREDKVNATESSTNSQNANQHEPKYGK